MQIISSCTILLMMISNIVCAEKKSCTFTFTPAKITAVPGLCVLVSCTFACPDTTTSTKTIMSIIILKNKNTEKDIKTERFKMLETDMNKNNCSFILEDIKADDAGEYTFRVGDAGTNQIKTYGKVKIIIQDEPVIEVPPLRAHEQANLSCSAASPCPETPPHITWWITKREGKIPEVKNDTTFTTSEVFYNSTLTFTPTSDLHNATVGCDVSYGNKINISTRRIIEVMYVNTLRILGNDTVKEGETLNLSCILDSHPASSVPLWIFIGTTDKLQNISGENLSYTNVSKKHGGEYVCAVAYMNVLLTTSININIINNSNETKNPDSPENQNMTGTDTKDRNVTSNITAFLDFMAHTTTHVFLMGMATSAIIFSVLLCCWVSCKRAKKPKVQTTPADSAVNLKMVQTNIDLTVTNEQTPLHNQSDAGMSNTPVESTGAEEESEAGGAEDGEAGEAAAGDVDYAAIDYSLLKKKSPEEGESKSMDTEYAEIKRDGKGRNALQNEHDHTEDQKQNEEEELYSNPDALKGQA